MTCPGPVGTTWWSWAWHPTLLTTWLPASQPKPWVQILPRPLQAVTGQATEVDASAPRGQCPMSHRPIMQRQMRGRWHSSGPRAGAVAPAYAPCALCRHRVLAVWLLAGSGRPEGPPLVSSSASGFHTTPGSPGKCTCPPGLVWGPQSGLEGNSVCSLVLPALCLHLSPGIPAAHLLVAPWGSGLLCPSSPAPRPCWATPDHMIVKAHMASKG